MNTDKLFSFYKNKRVLVTGHTGFKGSWMITLLNKIGASSAGYALACEDDSSLFDIAGIKEMCLSKIGDINDYSMLRDFISDFSPEIIFHMAAQPIVRISYDEPVKTYETNVMGTVKLFEAIRYTPSVRSVVNVTTDKVYKNNEWSRGYNEDDTLGGFDPYSNSKACSELVTECFKDSFFSKKGVAVSTCRAGNVIGGGDFAKERIIPDCIRAAEKGIPIVVRNPDSIRPFQHVLDALTGYLRVAMAQFEDPKYQGSYNIGPDDNNCITVKELVELFCKNWNDTIKNPKAEYICQSDDGPHEADLLLLDSTKIRSTLGFSPKYDITDALRSVIEWNKEYYDRKDMLPFMYKQIDEFMK